jgi:hypothetical protein
MDQIWSLLNNFIWHFPSCQIDRDRSPIFVQRQFLNNANFCTKNWNDGQAVSRQAFPSGYSVQAILTI